MVLESCGVEYPGLNDLSGCLQALFSVCLLWYGTGEPFSRDSFLSPCSLLTSCLLALQIGDRSGELTAQVNMAQLRSALGLGPGEEDVGTVQHYSGYEAQGECPGSCWRCERCRMVHGEWEVLASGRESECWREMRLSGAFPRKEAAVRLQGEECEDKGFLAHPCSESLWPGSPL